MANLIKRTVYVIGIEQEDRLIKMDCPFCGQEEFRIHPQENLCEKTGEMFWLMPMQNTQDNPA